MTDWQNQLRSNVEEVEARIQRCCQQSGRSRSEVKLIAITKYVSETVIQALIDLGQKVIGESRPQALWSRAPQFPQAVWHLVGHLQRNKVERTLPLVQLIHSVDSLRLLHAIEQAAQVQQKPAQVLLEMHLTDEPSKHGFTEAALEDLPDLVRSLKHVHVRGFMTMAALNSTPAQALATFARLRTIRERMQTAFSTSIPASELSMGMTHDFEQAIAEGATMIRIGSALFNGIAEITA